MKREIIKKFSILHKKGELEYNVLVNKIASKNHDMIEYSIYTSQSSVWTEHFRGVFLFGLINTGNGFKFKKQKKKFTDYGYDEALYLFILLSIDRKLCKTSTVFEVVEAPLGESFTKI